MSKPRYTPEEVIAALKQARGIKLAAARILGCDRATIDNYVRRSKAVRDAYTDQRQSLVDIAEGQLIKKLDKGEWDAVKFTLTTLGRDRGYGERSLALGLTVTPEQLRTMSNEELDALEAQLNALIAGAGA